MDKDVREGSLAPKEGLPSHSNDQDGRVLVSIQESLSSYPHSFGQRGKVNDGKQPEGD